MSAARPTLDAILMAPSCVAVLPREVRSELLVQAAAVQAALAASFVGDSSANGIAPSLSNTTAAPEPTEKLLTIAETAALLRRQPRWVYRHLSQFPSAVRRLGRRNLVIVESELRRWLDSPLRRRLK